MCAHSQDGRDRLVRLAECSRRTGLPLRPLKRAHQKGCLPAIRLGNVWYIQAAFVDALFAVIIAGNATSVESFGQAWIEQHSPAAVAA